MKTNGRYGGILTPLVTPLMPDRSSVDVPAMIALVDRQIKAGINGFLILGGTGEYPALTVEQRAVAVKAAADGSRGRVPIVAGVLEPGLGECINVGRTLIEAGADSLLILTPYYVHPGQEGIYQFYKKVDEALNFPFFVYNIPYRTSVNAEPATVARLADELSNMIGMKECSPSFPQIPEVLLLAKDKCEILSGEEYLMPAAVASGAPGGMIAAANLIPEVIVEIFALASNGKLQEAQQLMGRYLPLMKLLYKDINPGPMKYAMSLAGIQTGGVSLPLFDPTDELKAQIAAEMKRMNIIV